MQCVGSTNQKSTCTVCAAVERCIVSTVGRDHLRLLSLTASEKMDFSLDLENMKSKLINNLNGFIVYLVHVSF